MRCLIDTHVLLWWLFDDPKLTPSIRAVIADADNTILVSSAAAFEIATKHRIGKLEVPAKLLTDFEGCIHRAGFVELPMTIRHAVAAGSWNHPHKDPFDRMYAAQSAVENLPLITSDKLLEGFGIQVIWE